jgi:hypothetical protein
VGIFCNELMACAALVQIGPARQSFWALHVRDPQLQRERTRLLPRRGEIELVTGRAPSHSAPANTPPADAIAEPGRLRIRDRGVALDLQLDEDSGVEALCAHGHGTIWTRKQAGIAAHGTLAIDGGPPHVVQALAVIDDTAGHHARHTEWRWCAGVGERADGTALAWNLVSGVNDPPSDSERAVWVSGTPFEPAPVDFSSDLARIDCTDGSTLHFQAETERARHDNLLIVSSDYRAPFGRFSGTLPGGIELARGLGVAEHHRARW